MNSRFFWPKIHSVKEMILGFFWPGTKQRNVTVILGFFLARSATHYKFGVNPRFSWPKIHSVKDTILGFSWPGIADSARDIILEFFWPDHSARNFYPWVFLTRFVDPWGAILKFSWPNTPPNNKMAFGFSWPSCPLDTQVFLA